MAVLDSPDVRRAAAPDACDPSCPSTHSDHRLARFPRRRAAYIARVLTPAELAVIADPADALILARIKRMSAARLRRFDRLIPYDGDHQLYRTLQMGWLRDEEYLLGTRLGRPPTPRELFVDFMAANHGLRFRAYFALKYPERVRRVGSPAGRA